MFVGSIGQKVLTDATVPEFDVLLNVFHFTDPDDAKIKVDFTSEDFQQLYELGKGEELIDIHLKMNVESDVLSFFGSKNPGHHKKLEKESSQPVDKNK